MISSSRLGGLISDSFGSRGGAGGGCVSVRGMTLDLTPCWSRSLFHAWAGCTDFLALPGGDPCKTDCTYLLYHHTAGSSSRSGPFRSGPFRSGLWTPP